MLLNEKQIAEAKERAEQVVNGFTRIRDQQARDVVNLAETLELRNKQLARLVEELKKRGVGAGSPGGFSDMFGDVFGDVFGKDAKSFFDAKGFGQKKSA